MAGWVRRALVVLGTFAAFAMVNPVAAQAAPDPRPGLIAGCGFLEINMLTYSPDDHLFEFSDNGKVVWSRRLMGDNRTHEPADEGHTYRLVGDSNYLYGELVYHRPPVCDSAKLSVKVSSEPSCEPRAQRVSVHNDGTSTVRATTTGWYGVYTDFVDIPAGEGHDFVGGWPPYVAVETPGGAVPYYAVPALPDDGCGKFTSTLTAICGSQVRWDVSSDAIGSQSLAIFREFGPTPTTPAPVWLGKLPAHGKLTVYATVQKDDVIKAALGGLRPGTQDAYFEQVLSEIDGYAEPAACAKPEQAAVTFKAGCDGPTATITNYGAEREFTVTAGTVRTVKLAPGEVATIKIPLATGATAAVAVSGQDAFAEYEQRTCPTSPTPSPSPSSSSDGSGGGGGLPITGSPIAWVALGGAALLLAGIALTLATRRRRTFTSADE
ncbi:hypothetical protein [Paractinoplanes durhamensis]|uniref:Uncharacterized protein n=1 Tax=Paractinoplanes durhamensis TaxID=113563 RepID=A0ABQ3YV04_9ACTN|nr:hypothetical protein [Actinoplanes durhamensis]GIE01425.1 hypothetical protein Adu01nite_27750 [Actinoplanes durhamensis]